jgi:SAM-dependent methyltransferase
MEPAVAQRLIALNNQFYQTFAEPFSATRQRLQPGVLRILKRLPKEVDILDLGCGNGELWRALARTGFPGHYIGLDFSPALLEIAADHPGQPGQAKFLFADLAEPEWDAHLPLATFDFILAFAVLHHLPGSDLHLRLLTKIRSRQAAGGRFILSAWQFLNSPRLAARLQPWERIGLTAEQVEPGDYLLDWRQGGSGLRYVHQFDSDELHNLARAAGFTILEEFLSDGENGRLGLYQVWQPTNDGLPPSAFAQQEYNQSG